MKRIEFSTPSRQAGFWCGESVWGYVFTLVLVVSAAAMGLWGGYKLCNSDATAEEARVLGELRTLFRQERQTLAATRMSAQQHLDALALRLGQLQAHMIRLDALGERLTAIGKLDPDEFDFGAEPALGGPEEGSEMGEDAKVSELVADIERMVQIIDDRERKLDLLEDLIMNRKLEKELRPSGRPIRKGWISSFYGKRKDPFTGRTTMHKGMDFAAKEGSDVIAVASGLVTYAGERSGYGKLVEIRHGGGYSTRYGHNSEVLVSVGDRVSQGQVIAKMGSSGRSTGPHVHLEVLRNGVQVNPERYVTASR